MMKKSFNNDNGSVVIEFGKKDIELLWHIFSFPYNILRLLENNMQPALSSKQIRDSKWLLRDFKEILDSSTWELPKSK